MFNALGYISCIAVLCSIGLKVSAGTYRARDIGVLLGIGAAEAAIGMAVHPYIRGVLLPFWGYIAPIREGMLIFGAVYSVGMLVRLLDYERPAGYTDLVRHSIAVRRDEVIIGGMPFMLKKERGRYVFMFYYRFWYEENIFLRHIGERYAIHRRLNRCANTCTFSLTEAELTAALRDLRLVAVKDEAYIMLKGCAVEVRRGGFRYTVVMQKADAPHLPLETLATKARRTENGSVYCYRNLRKADVAAWLEQARTE